MKPYINEIAKSRSYVNEFRGYNHNEGISEKEMYDCYNLTSDEYPVLSTRKPRGALAGYSNVLGLLGGEGLAVVGEKGGIFGFYYDGEYYDVGLTESDMTSRRQLIRAGSVIYIFPDGTGFDVLTKESAKEKAKEHYGPKFLKEYTLSYCEISMSDGGVTRDINVDGENYRYGIVDEGGDIDAVRDKNDNLVSTFVKVTVPDEQIFADGILDNDYALNKLSSDITFYEEKQFGTGVGHFFRLEGSQCYAVRGVIKGGYNQIQIKENGAQLCQKYYGNNFSYYEPTEEKDYALKFSGILPPPLMDYVVECQNRLWGCRRGLDVEGNEVNAIYCTRLGNLYDWYTRDDGLADSASEISVGTSGEFTGAITLSQNPIFFKENCAHKVYVSASGAHQVYTLDVRGVEAGSAGSLTVVNENVIYKGVRDVLLFDGTNVTPISDAFGDVQYRNAVAGADGNKYVMYCEKTVSGAASERYVFTFDTRKGIWHRELIDRPVGAMTVYNHRLYIGTDVGIVIHEASGTEDAERDIRYMLESGVIGYESPEAKTLCRIDFRVRLALGASFTVWLEYDSDGSWIEAARHRGTTATPMCESVYVLPRRCDHFRYKITGTGDMKLYSVSRVYERSER